MIAGLVIGGIFIMAIGYGAYSQKVSANEACLSLIAFSAVLGIIEILI